METLGFLLGVAVFELAVRFKKPLRKAAVFTTGQMLSVFDSIKTSAYGFKEEVEDIIAEAQYENMKKNAKDSADEGMNGENDKRE